MPSYFVAGWDWSSAKKKLVHVSAQHPAIALGMRLYAMLHNLKTRERALVAVNTLKQKLWDGVSGEGDVNPVHAENARIALQTIRRMEEIENERKRQVVRGGAPVYKLTRDVVGNIFGDIWSGAKDVANAAADVVNNPVTQFVTSHAADISPYIAKIPIVGPAAATGLNAISDVAPAITAGANLIQQARGGDPSAVQKIADVKQLASDGHPQGQAALQNLKLGQAVINVAEGQNSAALGRPVGYQKFDQPGTTYQGGVKYIAPGLSLYRAGAER